MAYLPGMEPDSAAPHTGPLPPFWQALIEHAIADDIQRGTHPNRARADALRVVRAALYITSRPPVKRRRGRVRMSVSTRDLVWELYPGDAARGVLRTDRFAPTRRTLDRLDVFPQAVAGGVLFPVRRATWQAPDVLAAQSVAFDVTYPVDGGNGPAYDRTLMAEAGPEPRRFLAYLAAVFARWRREPVDLGTFASAVHAAAG